MTSPRKEARISDLRSRSHDTDGCVPVRRSVVRGHAAVAGETAKVSDATSSSYMGEANFTAEAHVASARSRRSAGAVVPMRHSGLVFILDADRRPLDPCPSAYARRLLASGKAAVFRRFPFTLILKGEPHDVSPPSAHRIKIDPGSKATGIAVLQGETVVFAAELAHRGCAIRESLGLRRGVRRSRRNRHTRYRKPRFENRRRPDGWLAPSLEHRVHTTLTWVRRLGRLCPLSAISVELVKFDTQKMANPEIAGVEYQQGELAGYEVREYLLEKWNRKCAYCGATNVPLQVEHIVPKSRGGSDRVSNLTLACRTCNERKGSLTAAEFGYPMIQERVQEPLRDGAAVNATRWALYESLKATGLPVEVGTGARTKMNRVRLGLPKAHWIDAACVGTSAPTRLNLPPAMLRIAAAGHGSRKMCGTDKHGFPIRHRSRNIDHFGFRTGDIVRAEVSHGKRKGVHVGRVLCRASGSFDIQTASGRVAGINWKWCKVIHKRDGYRYHQEDGASSPRLKAGASAP